MNHPSSLQAILNNLGQGQLWPSVSSWDKIESSDAAHQLSAIDPSLFQEQKRLLHVSQKPFIEPPRETAILTLSQYTRELGKTALQAGKVGAILVAGGQGTRLGFQGPKGCYPVTQVKGKTLFQLFAEKLRAASDRYHTPLSMAIMTSPLNYSETVSYFENNAYFGCDASQFTFFKQGMLPFLSKEGNLVIERPGSFAFGPDGNGSTPHAFLTSGIAEKWQRQGIEYVTFNLVDNPLSDPFDPLLVGIQAENRAEVILKCIERKDPSEKLGIVVGEKGHLAVVEYTEMPDDLWSARSPSQKLIYRIANISLFSFLLSFLIKVGQNSLPLHKAWKNVLPEEGVAAWKFERYIFDVLPFAQNAKILLQQKEECFAPLKNGEGEYGLASVQNALIASDRRVLASITGKAVPKECLEVSQGFYYPSASLIEKWQGREPPPEHYVEI